MKQRVEGVDGGTFVKIVRIVRIVKIVPPLSNIKGKYKLPDL